MGGDGAWAGHLELHAASVLLQHNVSVYQAGQPVWHIRNFQEVRAGRSPGAALRRDRRGRAEEPV